MSSMEDKAPIGTESLPPAQTRLAGRGDAEAVQQTQGVVIEEAAEVLATDVEGGHRRQEDRAGVDQAPHVLDVDEAVRRLAEPEDERPALLQGHGAGAVDQSAGGACG